MAAGPTIRVPAAERTLKAESWRLLKSPTLVQTALSVANLCTDLFDISFSDSTLALEVVDVSGVDLIQVQFWGAIAADTETPIVDVYGWHETGPGAHIGKLTLAHGPFTTAALTGWHANTKVSKTIRDVFLPGTAYRGCDTYTVTNDYQLEIITETGPLYYQHHRSLSSPRTIADATPVVDFPTYVNVNFVRSRYKYFGAMVTTAAATASSTLGAIYRPLVYRKEWNK